MSIYDFQWAKAEFAKARNPHRGRPVANNTRLVKTRALDENGDYVECYGIRLHATVVVTFLPSGNVKLNSGGWTTVTTQDRINSFSPARVWTQQRYTDTGARAKTPWGELDKGWAVASAEAVAVTPPRVQRCRACKGEGTITTTTSSGYVWHPDHEFDWAHARWIEFQTPTVDVSKCHRCDGTGSKDYGSVKVYPAFFDGIIVSPTGDVVETKAKVLA